MRGVTLLLASMILSGTPVLAAESSTASASVNCAEVQEPSGASDSIKAIYAQIKEHCAQIQLQDVSAQLRNAQIKDVTQALAGFSNIQGTQGKITNADKANHIGEWIAKRAMFDAGTKISASIKDRLAGGKYFVVNDASAVTDRAQLAVAEHQLASFERAIALAAKQGNDLIKGTPAAKAMPADGIAPRIGIVPLLTLIPPAITATKSLSTLFRSDHSLSSISANGDPLIVLSGLGNCLPSGVRNNLMLAQYGSGPNTFLNSYKQVQDVAANAKPVADQLDSLEQSLESQKDPLAAKFRSAKNDLNTAINSFVAFDKSLNVIPQGGTKTKLETLSETSARFSDPSAGYLVLHIAHVGASGGTKSSTFMSDKLEFQATAQIAFFLLDNNGSMLVAGAVPGSAAVSGTVGRMEKLLSEPPKAVSCPT